jgi:hypothetical protein
VHAQSATTSSWGYEDDPWKGLGSPLLGDADFSIFFNLCFIGSIGFDDPLPIHHWQMFCLSQPALVVVGLLAHTSKL